ncbi:MAG: DUF1553 domain-containing protein [Pirellulales bacterium]
MHANSLLNMARTAARLALAASCLAGISPLVAEDAIDYVGDVKPIFKQRCYACHGALKQEGGLRLDTVAMMLRGGDSDAAIEPGNAEESAILLRVCDTDESSRMPQQGTPLTAAEIATLTNWIKQGAAPPKDDAPEPDPHDHWAFKRLVRPEPPNIPESNFPIVNPVDLFIAAEHVKRGLQPVSPADKPAMLRRVYLDLIGLPPTRDELHAFMADASPDAYEKVVDSLLSSPQYGERWGRHWMDVWRYSDWYGRRNAQDVTNSYPMIWRWRDWIVHSLNEDKGYDRMVLEMLAADEVEPENDEDIVATGFLVRNCFRWNYNQWMKDNVEHTAKAFLGLTLNCAHCHDHKYDPLSQEEYFGFRAFFEPLELRQDRAPGSADPGPYKKYVYLEKCDPIRGGLIRVFDEKIGAETRMYSGGDERNVMEDVPPVEPHVPAILGIAQKPIEPINLPPVAAYPGLKPFIADEELAKAQAAIVRAEQVAAKAKRQLKAEGLNLTAGLEEAQVEVAKWDMGESDAGPSQALAGKRSLFLKANRGRRTLSNNVSAFRNLQDGTTISFQVLLVADGHASFQLSLNTMTGATGAYIAFQQGRILTYLPGTYEVIEIGNYNLPAGQNRFQVTARLKPSKDVLVFTVKELESKTILVDKAEGALHGWNPAERPEEGIILDARPGTIVAFDEIVFAHPGGKRVVRFDFEDSSYSEGQDVVGREGWEELPFCVAPAVSMIGHRVDRSGFLVLARRQLAIAQSRLEALRLGVPAAKTAVMAAKAELESLQSRIAAGNARYLNAENAADLARKASRAERTAVHAGAVAQEQASELALAEVEAKPGDAKQREAVQSRYEKAHQAVVAAVEALTRDDETFTPITPTYPTRSSGRRTALARAIVDRNNPLTARVAVNHIWMRHFGRPLVESVFDFGRNGKKPTHPELLDWLAAEFMDSNWSMKHLHRLIVMSGAYRMSSPAPADSPNHKLDPDNQFLWRFPRQRMQAEVVRDSILKSAGQLDLTLGGPEIEQGLSEKTRRRSLYTSHHGEGRDVMLETFNAASPLECYRRIETVVPQQALAFANSKLTLEASRALAHRLWEQVVAEVPDERDREIAFVEAAYEQLLTRSPQPAEREASLELMRRQIDVYQSPRAAGSDSKSTEPISPSIDPIARARESLIHALFSHHDFISVR